MSAVSSIEWTDKTWNPVRGCSIISPGCVNCYAMKQAHRFSGPGRAYEGLTKLTAAGPQWTGRIRTVGGALLEPLKWRKPARIFVNSMSDLFHEDVPVEFIAKVFSTMALARRHTFQILTKRADRMRAVVSGLAHHHTARDGSGWPLPNVWLGVSVEDQKHADERIPLLLQTPAAVRFISAEPLLGPIQFDYGWLTGCDACCNGDRCPGPPECMRFDRRSCPVCKGTAKGINLDWVIVGGESGPGARPFDIAWARSIVEQCKAAGVPVFVKQLGKNPISTSDSDHGLFDLDDKKGGDMAEWPEDVRVREFPRSEAVA